MQVIALTILCSLLLAGLFAVLYLRDHGRNTGPGRVHSPEQASLLPLREEESRTPSAQPHPETHSH